MSTNTSTIFIFVNKIFECVDVFILFKRPKRDHKHSTCSSKGKFKKNILLASGKKDISDSTKMNLNKFYLKWATIGTANKTTPSRQNLQACKVLHEFAAAIDFENVDYKFYTDYTKFLRDKKKV